MACTKIDYPLLLIVPSLFLIFTHFSIFAVQSEFSD